MVPTLELVDDEVSEEVPLRKLWQCQKCGRKLCSFGFTATIFASEFYGPHVVEKETEYQRQKALAMECDCG